MSYPNGIVTSYGYDAESRLTSLGASLSGSPITSFSYVLDAAGNRTRKTTLDWVEDYTYDERYRLLSADRSAGTPTRWRFAYDPAGNRTGDQTDDAAMGATFSNTNELLTRQPGGVLAFRGSTNEPATVTVAGAPARTASDNSFRGQATVGSGTTDVAVVATDPAGNARTNTYRVTAAGAGTSFTYDSNGNLNSKTEGSDTWTYTWNAENQLTRVDKNSVEQARFSYDPLGRRVEKIAGGTTTTYAYEGSNILREMRGGTTLKYVHGSAVDEPLAVDDGTAVSYFHADALGSIAKMTNAAGHITLSRRYGAWGVLETGASEPGYAFTGREWDPETSLYYYRVRHFDATIGRFLSDDPIADRARDVLGIVGMSDTAVGSGGATRGYTFPLNDPVNVTDPSGMAGRSASRDCSPRSPDCQNYSPCYSYQGANAGCFCRCAGNDPWSRRVRCCLFDKYDAGWGAGPAHYYCYAEATATAGLPPATGLIYCWAQCRREQEYSCGCSGATS